LSYPHQPCTRVRVRGSHKRDRRPPFVRWNCGVRAEPCKAAGSGRSNGVRPSLSSDFLYLFPDAVHRYGNPTRLHGPAHVRRTLVSAAKPCNLDSASPPRSPGRLHHQTRGTAELLLPLLHTCDVPEPGSLSVRLPRPSRRFSVCVFFVASFVTRERLTDHNEDV
jgi:hypothetical protein